MIGPHHPDPEESATFRRRYAKQRLLQMHYESGVGHLGGNLSSLDLLLTLYHDIMTTEDQFVLSKGHAAGALYVALWSKGFLTDEQLQQFHRDGTQLSGHPPARGIAEVLFATGSLGHGLGLAAGLALGRQLQKKPGLVYCLLSDGEWNEGSTWESLIFAHHQRLSNLRLIIDLNGLQGFGTTKEVADLSPLAEKLHTFGISVIEVDGHDHTDIRSALSADGKIPSATSGPVAIVAHTIKGHGVSFMENRMEWHYLPMNAEQYSLAQLEVQRDAEVRGG